MSDPAQGPAEAGVSAFAGVVPLPDVPLDTCAVIEEVRADSDDIDLLKTMGVCEGRRVMLVRKGDPMILKVLGARIGLSARLAQQVLVRACPAGTEEDGA